MLPWQVLRMKVKPYVPDFKTAFEHFCIHTGGRGVIDEVSLMPSSTLLHLLLMTWQIDVMRHLAPPAALCMACQD